MIWFIMIIIYRHTFLFHAFPENGKETLEVMMNMMEMVFHLFNEI